MGKLSRAAIIGDGIGEVAASYVSGNLSLEHAVRIATECKPDASRFQKPPIAALANEGFEVFLEVGPHPILASTTIKECLGSGERSPLILASLRRGDRGLESMRMDGISLSLRERLRPRSGLARSRHRAASCACRVIHGSARAVLARRRGETCPAQPLRETSERERNDGTSSPAPHQNGRSNGHHAAAIEDQPALITNHDVPAELPSGIRLDGIAALPGDVHIGQLSSLPSGTTRRPTTHRVLPAIAWARYWGWLQIESIRIGPLMSLGLDSLSAMDLKVEIDAGLRTTLPRSMLMEVSGIRELAEWASDRLADAPAGSIEPAAPADCVQSTVEASPPLSHGQQMLWYAHQFTTTGAAYHVLGAGMVRTELNKGAFRQAMRRVVSRQAALRTTFVLVDEKPSVRLLDLDDLAVREGEWLPIEDVAGCNDAALRERLAELARSPFDLERGPLFRVHLLSRSASEHVFLLVFHHIIADFWSTAVFLDDFKTAYTALCVGQSGELPYAGVELPPSSARWQPG